MLKIERSTNDSRVVLVVSGRIERTECADLQRALIAERIPVNAVTLDLQEVRLVDRDAVHFLVTCVRAGVRLVNTPPYVREWMRLEGYSMTNISTAPIADTEQRVTTTLRINGADRSVTMDVRSTLLDVLRERLQLTGTKKGCDQGTCGACTVMVEGQRVLACLTLAVSCQGHDVGTIEGLSGGEALTAVQEAFYECDAYQCGFCTPGQIMSATALIEEVRAGVPSHVTPDVTEKVTLASLSDDEIRERMSGNLCRCGAYPNIVDAVRSVIKEEGRR